MKAIAFDTLEFVKRLRAANFTEAQAEAMAEAIAAVVTDQLATKADLQELRRELGSDINELRRQLEAGLEAGRRDLEAVRRDLETQIEAVRRDLETQNAALRRDLETHNEAVRRDVAELRREIKESEYRVTIRLGGMLAAAVAVVAALVKLL
jgi:Skp family chaperone for outer membrane proteins